MIRNQLLAHIRHQLTAANVPDAANESRDLVLASLQLTRTELAISPEAPISTEQTTLAISFANRRIANEPIDRILGYREFYGEKFYLNKDTLSPREDSECVVDLALRILDSKQHDYKILDLGTGTGCLLLTLLAQLPNSTGLGVDLSPNALKMARKNADSLGLIEKVKFKTSNWFETITTQFDLIISNPPYIETSILPQLEREVRDFDPALALDGGSDGLNCYRLIAAGAKQALLPNRYIVVEIGIGQENQVCQIFADHGFTMMKTCNDGGNILRGIAFSQAI